MYVFYEKEDASYGFVMIFGSREDDITQTFVGK